MKKLTTIKLCSPPRNAAFLPGSNRFSLLRFAPLRSALCVLLLIFCTCSAVAQSEVNQFIWDQANTQVIHAEEPGGYLKAAESYHRLLRDGVVNAPLLNNLGVALTMGGDLAHAAAAFKRAEIYSGTTPEIKKGLIAIMARQTERAIVELPWYRTAFFWHYGIPARARITIALTGWSLLWAGILLYRLRKRSLNTSLQLVLTLSETCMITGALICLIFSSSAAFTLLQEKHSKSLWAAAQFSSTVISNSEEHP
ncbi:MAG: hypothetical protein PHO37_12145 [Kiritimatiellae bacterium]|nr:hypothetical protein [Kiritimatiellia bacterium]